MGNRQAAVDFFIEKISEIDKKSENIKMYKEFFDSLDDKAFEELVVKIEEGKVILPYFVSNLHSTVLRMEKILKVADSLGIDFFQRVWVVDPETGVKYLTPEKYMVVDLPIRRQQQHLVKGKSLVENSKYTDPMTGQASGPSRSSRLSLPEIMILESAGHLSSIEEMLKVRGGDVQAFREARRLTVEHGGYSLKSIEDLGTRPTSTETLKAFLFGMHIDNNL